MVKEILSEAKILEKPETYKSVIEVDGKEVDILEFLTKIYNDIQEIKNKL
jgi:hypothetical protein